MVSLGILNSLKRIKGKTYGGAGASASGGLGRGAAAARFAARSRRSSNSDARRSAAEVTLGSHDHVVKGAERQASSSPRVKVVAGRDGASDALGSADRPVLLKGRGALDGWRVGAGGLVNVVRAAVAGHLADLGSAGRWVVGSVGLDDVVFDERARGPAVEREVAVAIGAIGTGVLDGSGNKSVFRHCSKEARVLTDGYQGSIPCHQQSCLPFAMIRCTGRRRRWCRSRPNRHLSTRSSRIWAIL